MARFASKWAQDFVSLVAVDESGTGSHKSGLALASAAGDRRSEMQKS